MNAFNPLVERMILDTNSQTGLLCIPCDKYTKKYFCDPPSDSKDLEPIHHASVQKNSSYATFFFFFLKASSTKKKVNTFLQMKMNVMNIAILLS